MMTKTTGATGETTAPGAPATSQDAELRKHAISRLRKRRDFYGHVLVYLLVNAFLVVIWAVTDLGGFFWPVFPIVGWGIGVAINAWDVYRRDMISEEQISKEIKRLHGRR